MPRRMPRFDLELQAQSQLAIAIVRAGEIARASGERNVRDEWSAVRIEALYELAYLRVFSAWETFLESVFYRSLCGYASSAGQETLVAGAYYASIAAAEAAVLGGQAYTLWHDPNKVIRRCQRFIRTGAPGCIGLQESTIASNATRLQELAAVRHRIVHDQADAKRKFDAASASIAGRTYPASRPGKFLRDRDATPLAQRWLDVTIGELLALARQMV
jgi:hypothetical protein